MLLISNTCHLAVSCSVFVKCFCLVLKKDVKRTNEILEFYPFGEAGAAGSSVSEGQRSLQSLHLLSCEQQVQFFSPITHFVVQKFYLHCTRSVDMQIKEYYLCDRRIFVLQRYCEFFLTNWILGDFAQLLLTLGNCLLAALHGFLP